jgi:NAD(P)-dependent dehydrogenase (short-subunit alcohol dehydrogenase family)
MKRYAITGTTSGIGLETAKALTGDGHEVLMLNRNQEKAETARQALPHPDNATLIPCDLADLSKVQEAADTIKAQYDQLDGLINNAGGIFPERTESPDGIEFTFAVNHLGHFLLTQELAPLLKQGDKPRIINVSSEAHKSGKPDFNDIELKQNYSGFQAYGNAKLYNIYFAQSLAEQLKADGISANAVHPGFVYTRFGRDFKGWVRRIFSLLYPFMIDQQKGAAPIIELASTEKGYDNSGIYFKRHKPAKAAPVAYNQENREKLWELSEGYIQKVLA